MQTITSPHAAGRGRRAVRVVLAFPPFAIPTDPPLGIAMLKSFLERAVERCRVECLDLNLAVHDDLVKALGPAAAGGAPADGAVAFARAAQVFRGREPGQFLDPGSYHALAGAFFCDLAIWHERLSDACRGFVEDAGAGPERAGFLSRYAGLLLEREPDLVGLSVTFPEQLPVALALARLVKAREPRVRVALGGSCLTPAHVSRLACTPGVDDVVHGPGEAPLAAIVRALAADRDPGRPCAPDAPAPCDLAEAPGPDFGDLPTSAYFNPEPCLPVLSARGCSWRRCAFCVHHQSYGGVHRARPVHRVLDDLAEGVRRGVRHFRFADEHVPPARLAAMSRGIADRGLRLDYLALARPTREFTGAVLEEMAAAGCRAVLWGVESASQRILDRMDKGTRAEDLPGVLARAAAAGIRNHVFVILGFPTETRGELEQTLRFLYENRRSIDAVQASQFGLNPGSRIDADPGRFGVTRIHDRRSPRDEYDYEVSTGLTQGEARALLRRHLPFFRSFSAFSWYLPLLRSHALIVYSALGREYDRLRERRTILDPTSPVRA